jgi:hypothetical protein
MPLPLKADFACVFHNPETTTIAIKWRIAE